MQHTINNTTTRNEFVALLKDLVRAHAALDVAKQHVQEFITKHKLTREQAKPYVMTYCANRYGVPLFDDYTFAAPDGYRLPAIERAKLPKAKQTAIKSWFAAKDAMKRILNDAGLHNVLAKPRVVHKVDAVEKLLKEFGKLSKAQQRRFMESI